MQSEIDIDFQTDILPDILMEKDAEIFQLKTQLQLLIQLLQKNLQRQEIFFLNKLSEQQAPSKINNRTIDIEGQSMQELLKSYRKQVEVLEEQAESQANHIRNLERTISETRKSWWS